MTRRKLFLFLAAAGLLFLQFADCVSAATPNQQDMRCCVSLTCGQANQSQKCCEAMPSPQANMLPTGQVALHAPTVATIAQSKIFEIVRPAPGTAGAVEAQLHSPPELYTLHVSLLI